MASYRVTENSIYNGEKESIGAIRGIFDYDLEIKMIPGIRKIASRRHLHDFLYIQSHRHEMRKLLEYKKIAMEDDLPTACHVVDTGYIFKESDLLDRIEVLIIRIERQFVKLNNALNK